MAKTKGKGILHGMNNWTATGLVLVGGEQQSMNLAKTAGIYNQVRQFDGLTVSVGICDEETNLSVEWVPSATNIQDAVAVINNAIAEPMGQKFTIANTGMSNIDGDYILIDSAVPMTNTEPARLTLNLRKYETDISDDAPATP